MRELALLTFVTLDGVMQAPADPREDPSGRFEHSGWAMPYWDDVMAQVQREAMATPYDMLFGRRTYEQFAGHWTTVKDDPAADMMAAARKYVVSTGSPDLSWANSHLITGDVVAALRALKAEDGPLLQVHGSAGLIQTLIQNDLVDEFRLWVFPTLVGPGKQLFASDKAMDLTLRKSEALPNGVVMNIYRRAA